MRIKPVNIGTISVSQVNKSFATRYTREFPDTEDGRYRAYRWAWEIYMGWADEQEQAA
ncbi:DUF5444 family protein [Serratia fonticola]|uniref:DUF5444 family protein n=1 Tax=Serratia fonticola TaxID=47917 RepID=UPI001648C92A|nr:DUF5444 family protein [Serratia fonticola]MBC3250488.1 DUF5444 family protein [Serratia fonticola]